MNDLLFLVILSVLFASSWAVVRGVERL